jgi:phospholipid-binding lipoprotein MlaA
MRRMQAGIDVSIKLSSLALLITLCAVGRAAASDQAAAQPAGTRAPSDTASVTDTSSEEDVVDDFADDFADDFDALLDEPEELTGSEGFPDPLEPANRKILKFNQFANKWGIDPIAKGYAFVVPDEARFAVRRFFLNLNAPVTTVNDALQLEWRDAGMTIGAFLINSTLGLGGLFAPGDKLGFPRHRSDFGQTLALADVESGPYLVIPIMGPTNIRDGSGKIVDLFMRPASWFLGFGVLSVLAGTGEGIVVLEAHRSDLAELEKSSVDFYPVLRSAYYQNRMGEIWDRRQDHRREKDLAASGAAIP